MNKENTLGSNLNTVAGVSLQIFQKPGHKRKEVLGSVKDLSKMFKTQTLRFVRINPADKKPALPICVSVKVIPMSSTCEKSSHVCIEDEYFEGKTQERKMMLDKNGDYGEISLIPKYVKDKGMKKPACRVIVSLDGQTVKQWIVTVYNPHYGSRLKRDLSCKGFIFSPTCSGWSAQQVLPIDPHLNCRVGMVSKSFLEMDSKEFASSLSLDADWESLLSQLDSCTSLFDFPLAL